MAKTGSVTEDANATGSDVGEGRAAGNGAGSRPQSFVVADPAAGTEIATVAIDSPETVAETVRRVRANQADWERLGFDARRRWLGRLRDWLLDNEERVADILQSESGKVRADAAGESLYLADVINYYGSKSKRFLRDDRVRPHSMMMAGRKLRVQYRPHPVVGVISPWNFPLILSLGDAIPALQAGACVVIKPSELTPLSLGEIVRAWREEIGAPDVLAVVNGMADTGQALVDEADFVQFTGSDRAGREVMSRAARTLTPVSLELGGKDPMIVLDGAGVERAARAATWGGMSNSGQICMSVERIYVEEPIYDEFVDRLCHEVRELRQGSDGSEIACDVGSMTSPAQVDIVERHVEEAVAAGARALTGGRRLPGPGDFYEPTVLVDVDHSMSVMRDETFGPVVGVMKVADSEEALRLANDSRYGLSGSVFGPRREAERIARRVECGAVNVNDVLVNYLTTDVPMGGWKESGIGYRHGEYGIKKYCRAESIVVNRLAMGGEPLWFPYDTFRRRLVPKLARAAYARDIRRRFQSAPRRGK